MKNLVKNIVLVAVMVLVGFMVKGQNVSACTLNGVSIGSVELKEDGSQITIYKDNVSGDEVAFAYINVNDNVFEFTDMKDLGDWNFSVGSVDKLNNLILSWMSCYNDTIEGFEVVNTYIDKYNDFVIEYSDSSWSCQNSNNNYYEFFPAVSEDYTLVFDNEKDLNNCIDTYKSLKLNGWY